MKRDAHPRFVNASVLCLAVMLLLAPVISAGEPGSLGRPAAFDAILRREPPAAAAAPEALPWEWQDPVLVYDGSLACEEGWPQGGADLAADDSGNLYAAWLDCRTGEARAYFAFKPAGGAWGPSEPVDDPTHLPQGGIHVAVDGAGNAYLAWLGGEIYDPAGIYSRYRSSAGTWGAIEQVEYSDQDYQSDLDFTVDPAGNAYAVWLRVTYSPDYQQEVRFRRRPAGGGWGGSELVTGTPGVQHGAPQVAADSGGNIFVAWTDDSDGGDLDLFVAQRTGAGVWGTGVQVNDDAGTAAQSNPRLDVDGAGKLVLAWLDNRDGFDAIYWAVKPPEGSWGANQALTDASDWPRGVEGLDVNDAGAAAVIWEGYREGNSRVFSNYWPVDGSWSVREEVTYNTNGRLAIAVTGDGVATVIRGAELAYEVIPSLLVYSRNALGQWAADWPPPGDNANPSQHYPALAVDAAGNGYAVWLDDREGQSKHIYFAYRTAGGQWGANVRVDQDPFGPDSYIAPDIAVNATGDAWAVWPGPISEYLTGVYAAHRPAGGVWGASELVAAGKEPLVAVDASGNAHVAYADYNYGISYAFRPASGPWEAVVQVSDVHAGGAPGDIVVNSAGSVHIVWQSYAGTSVFHDYRPAGGAWGVDSELTSDPAALAGDPHIAVDETGNAQLVWMVQYQGIFAAYRPVGGAWGPARPITVYQYAGYPRIAADGLGNFHAFWRGADLGDTGVYFAYRTPGGDWTGPRQALGVYPDNLFSAAADASGAVYLAWAEPSGRQFQISHVWFSHAAYIGATQGNIAGMITAQDTGSPLQGISVTVFRFNGSAWVEIPSADASTDPQGYYSTGALDPGDYRVRFSDSTGAYMTEYFDDASSIDAATDIGVSAGLASMTDAVLALAPPGGIAGTVTDAVSAAPLSGITVTLYGIAPWGVYPIGGTTTNSSGAYAFTGLTPGIYFLEFADQQGAYVGEFYDNASQLYAATPITVAAGVTTAINVGLQPLSAPPAVPEVTISSDGANAVLSWTHDSANSGGYKVLFSQSPYFQPGDDNVTTVQATELTGWVHTGAAADADHNYCYLVRGVNTGGQESAPSNRTCEFTLRLTPGSVTAAAQ